MIALFAPDLMDRSRLDALGAVVVRPPFSLDPEVSVLVVDVDRLPPDAVLPDGVDIVGFGAHVDAEAHGARLGARGRFVARSVMFRDPLAAVGAAP